MDDTNADVAKHYRDLLLAVPGEHRVRMACDMFDCARQLMIARITADEPGISADELRVKVFLRTYGGDFDTGARLRIAAAIRQAGQKST